MDGNYSKILFSVIIPHRDSIKSLGRLFNSIPQCDDIEIILVDNSDKSIQKSEISIDRPYYLLYSSPLRYAGGARNEGLKVAQGKWVIFADSDDYFTTDAFDNFRKYADSEYDLVYFKMDSVYNDTLKHSDRGDFFSNKIDLWANRIISDNELKLCFDTPCCKMVRMDLIKDNNIQFDEIIASNDSFFSLLVGFYSQKFIADSSYVYVATTNNGSLTKKRSLPIYEARLNAVLRRNSFLKSKGLGQYQYSVMSYLYNIVGFGVIPAFKGIWSVIKYQQNPFVGCSNWYKSFVKERKINRTDKENFKK